MATGRVKNRFFLRIDSVILDNLGEGLLSRQLFIHHKMVEENRKENLTSAFRVLSIYHHYHLTLVLELFKKS